MTTLLEILRRAQDLGMFGPGAIEGQLAHAEAFVGLALADDPAAGLPFLDLGSGGGLPGLVLALRPDATGTLLDSQQRRAEFLTEAVAALGLVDRIVVVAGRAEEIARDPEHRGRYGLVTARSFASPAVTAECAVGFLAPGGRLVVSEPPGGAPERWASPQLAALGLSPGQFTHGAGASAARFDHSNATPPRWPRRPGIPSKRPLW